MTAKVTYSGNLRTVCSHLASGNEFVTDAPKDNHGLGEAFSPTDTIATGLASCMLTIMGIKANDLSVDLKGASADVRKHMGSGPRRIVKIEVVFWLPKAIGEKERTILERAANTCPVHHSLHPDIEKEITFNWVGNQA